MTLYKDIMPYFDKFIHVYGWNMSILWSPLKFWTPKKFTIAYFRHSVSKSWLRPCSYMYNLHLFSQTISVLGRRGMSMYALLVPAVRGRWSSYPMRNPNQDVLHRAPYPVKTMEMQNRWKSKIHHNVIQFRNSVDWRVSEHILVLAYRASFGHQTP